MWKYNCEPLGLASRGYEYDGFLFSYILFSVCSLYFYSNKIWCIEKLVLQYTIKSIDFTGMSTSQSTTQIIFKMDDDGSALLIKLDIVILLEIF
jgi:hypothetical protein